MKRWLGLVFGIFLIMPGVQAEEKAVVVEGTALEKLRAQVDIERSREQELQLLQLDVERLKLELEKKKAVLELASLSAGGEARNVGVQPGTESSLHVRYVSIVGTRKEAVIDADGVEAHVKEGDVWSGRMVRKISEAGVVTAAQDGQENFYPVKR